MAHENGVRFKWRCLKIDVPMDPPNFVSKPEAGFTSEFVGVNGCYSVVPGKKKKHIWYRFDCQLSTKIIYINQKCPGVGQSYPIINLFQLQLITFYQILSLCSQNCSNLGYISRFVNMIIFCRLNPHHICMYYIYTQRVEHHLPCPSGSGSDMRQVHYTATHNSSHTSPTDQGKNMRSEG